MMNNNFSIYIHIPFCEKRCIYCDFASFVACKKEKKIYFQSLKDEILGCNKTGKVNTIYFGGGTPSSVDAEDICEILNVIKLKFDVLKDAEITIECNPNSITLQKLEKYKKSGFNRISFGVQSMHDDMLKKLGRLHNRQQVFDALKYAHETDFKNISVDLLIGLPGQKTEDLLEDAKILLSEDIQHISAYMLQVEENTLLEKMLKNGQLTLPSEDESIEMYDSLVEFLKSQGFNRYEISNFAKPHFESRHNLNYWKRGEYLGFGLAAHSFLGGERIANPKDMKSYLQRTGIIKEKITGRESVEEIIMLGLRCEYGFSFSKVKSFGVDLEKDKAYQDFLQKNILIKKDDQVTLNPKYYEVSSSIICDLLPKD